MSVTLGTGCQPNPKEMERAAAPALRLTAISESVKTRRALFFMRVALSDFQNRGWRRLPSQFSPSAGLRAHRW